MKAAVACLGGSISLGDPVVRTVAHVRRRVEVGNTGVGDGSVVCVAVCVGALLGRDGRFPPPGQPSVFLLYLAVRESVSLEVPLEGEALLTHLTVIVLRAAVDQRVVCQTVLEAELLPTNVTGKLLHPGVGECVCREVTLLCKSLPTLQALKVLDVGVRE